MHKSNSKIYDLFQIYSKLSSTNLNKEVFSAKRIDPYKNIFVAKGANGEVAIIINNESNNVIEDNTTLSFKYFTYQAGCKCKVSNIDGEKIFNNVSLITCSSDDSNIKEYFLRAMSGIIFYLDDNLSASDSRRIILELVEVFKCLSMPPLTSIIGIWAELYLIANAIEINSAIDAWHCSPNDVYDFIENNICIEVKSTSRENRQHHFSTSQTTLLKSYIVSVLVDFSDSGKSIYDLIETIRANHALLPRQLSKFEKAVLLSIGSDWGKNRNLKYAIRQIPEAIKVYSMKEIPKFEAPLPVGIIEARYLADLSGIPSINKDTICKKKDLLKNVMTNLL